LSDFHLSKGIEKPFDYICTMRKLVHKILLLFGWNISLWKPEGIKKAVVVMGPHTSNWDFVLGRLAFYMMHLQGRYLVKKDIFFFPLGLILKALGAIPVDRSKNNNMVDYVAKLFKEKKELYVVFTPEGTRSYNPNWKKGFYYLAVKAEVPILLAYVDFPSKKGGFLEVFYPTGDVDADILKIKQKLGQFKGKYPEKGIIS